MYELYLLYSKLCTNISVRKEVFANFRLFIFQCIFSRYSICTYASDADVVSVHLADAPPYDFESRRLIAVRPGRFSWLLAAVASLFGENMPHRRMSPSG
jgi:hypothetical protein